MKTSPLIKIVCKVPTTNQSFSQAYREIAQAKLKISIINLNTGFLSI